MSAILIAFALAGRTPAMAGAGDWRGSERAQARLISAVEGAGELASVPAGLEIRLKQGWKTYWRSPGDAGLPPQIDWAGSTNVAGAAIRYPLPHRFTVIGLETFGYEKDVVLPLAVTPARPGQPLNLRAKVDLLVCEELCVPEAVDLALDIPAGAATPGPEAPLRNRFASQVPGDGRAAGLAIERVRMTGAAPGAALEVTASAIEPFVAPDVIAESDLSFGHPQVSLSDQNRRATITLPLVGAMPPGTSLGGRPVTLTLIDGERAMEQAAIVEAAPAAGIAAWLAALAPMLGLALLGGFILNLMPCVLPVLSLKLLSVVSRGGQASARIRADFLATAAGIVFSFLVLAGALIALKLTGRTIGWGIQFQQPVFVAAMIALVTLFACNMWGFFEVPLPRFVAERVGGASGGQESLAGHFATGAFATLLATPCSAPFLGTAVGFALAGGNLDIVAIFAALGVGLAVPYLVVAAAPRLASALPRPGRWMLRLKHVLGFALLGTALWLLTIITAQASLTLALVLGLMMAALIALLGAKHRLAALPASAVAAGAALLALGAVALAGASAPGVGSSKTEPGDAIAWVPFDRDQVRSFVSQGRTVLVDVTADWCLTCQANKRLVLDRAAVVSLLGEAKIVPMKADWTRPDPKVTAFLSSYGRYGIPFNIVYGPGAPAGVVLPEILTEQGVLDAVRRARQAS